MKKICISFAIVLIIILAFVGIYGGSFEKPTVKEYLRIHVRANSNDETDQAVKYKVKDKIVGFLSDKVAEFKTKSDAERYIKKNLRKIEGIADEVLRENGFLYESSARVALEEFPTRRYEDFCLESGFYDALIIDLGSGEGDNWWCVVYPPLCFTGSEAGYEYRSKIYEIINEFKKRNGESDQDTHTRF